MSGVFLSCRSLEGETFDQEFYKTGRVMVLGAAQTANVLWGSLGRADFIRADTMVRGHFLLLCTDSYVVKFVPYLVVVATSLCELWQIRSSGRMLGRTK